MTLDDLINHEFSRNIGLISEEIKVKLLETRVAVAGTGGVGGIHLLTLARMGIGNFSIADMDIYERANISRQFGAKHSTIGERKADVLSTLLKDINPAINNRIFPEGVNRDNIDEFLQGADFFVDGIDFFEIDIRRELFKASRKKGIFALTAAPLGFGATLQVFSPKGMTFDEYFGLNDSMTYLEKLAAFAAGLAPRPYHLKYLDLSKVSLAERRGPAVAPACTLAASLIATKIARISAGKNVKTVPYYTQLDLYRSKFRKGYLLWGGKNPIQRLKRNLILKRFKIAMARKSPQG
ncbi:MAG: ThiF family adenylyltransferase [Deltaproteobacteria bacterium]|nr:ThiF family adenylyltransferase [Deltaproteobacteria bacterium]